MSVARQKASPFWALSAKDLPAGSALVKALGPAISFADLLRENLLSIVFCTRSAKPDSAGFVAAQSYPLPTNLCLPKHHLFLFQLKPRVYHTANLWLVCQ
jgi:hypothetical protein